MSKTIVIFGADGSVGKRLVSQALDRGWSVRGVEKSLDESAAESSNLSYHQADVLNDDLASLVDGADAVISALGLAASPSTMYDPPPLYTKGTTRIVEAMKEVGVRRLLVISASFVATRDRGPIWFKETALVALDKIFRQMAEMERLLREADGIDWTAVRPGWLMEGELTRDYQVFPEVIPPDLIRTRHADLAHFMLNEIEANEWIGGTPAIARREPPSASGPTEVLKDVLPG